MFLFRLVLVVLLILAVRRLFRSLSGGGATGRGARPKDAGGQSDRADSRNPDYDGLTEQGIDDADFEEIP